jgi:hypothetical protein
MRQMTYMHHPRQHSTGWLFEQVLNQSLVLSHLNPDCQNAKFKFKRANIAQPTTKAGTQRYSGLEYWRVNNVVHFPFMNQCDGSNVRKGMFDYAN